MEVVTDGSGDSIFSIGAARLTEGANAIMDAEERR